MVVESFPFLSHTVQSMEGVSDQPQATLIVMFHHLQSVVCITPSRTLLLIIAYYLSTYLLLLINALLANYVMYINIGTLKRCQHF